MSIIVTNTDTNEKIKYDDVEGFNVILVEGDGRGNYASDIFYKSLQTTLQPQLME